MNDCIFCKIVVGEVPSEKIYENENVIAFLDISPITKGHVLVVTKGHYKDLRDAPADVICNVMKVVKWIAPEIVTAMGADGFNVGINNGKVSGQVVFHLHVHIIPRYENDNLKSWKGEGGYKEGEMKTYANKIRNYIPKV